MEGKRVADSASENVQILMPEHINGRNRLFGGRLMEWIDSIASVTARRHSGSEVITACVDNLEFIQAAYVNTTIILKAVITYTGRTSMEVRVDTYNETLDYKTTLINRAYLVFVAVDDNGKSKPVPPILPETDEEKREYEAGKQRADYRKSRRKSI